MYQSVLNGDFVAIDQALERAYNKPANHLLVLLALSKQRRLLGSGT